MFILIFNWRGFGYQMWETMPDSDYHDVGWHKYLQKTSESQGLDR